jgi:hypothetical protein
MTQEEILEALKNAKWSLDKGKKYEYTELLLFYDKSSAYSIHGVRYSDGIILPTFTKLIPKVKSYSLSDEQPYKEVENMKTMWFSELMEKYGGIFNAMRSIE